MYSLNIHKKMSLYPLLFEPTFHYRIWGGNKLKYFGKNITESKIGESWEISTVPGYISLVANGKYKGTNLQDLVFKYKEELLGTQVYQKYGDQFPLLIKFLDADQPLSVQVHPNDDYAQKHHNSFGKTEMWYILDAEKDAEIIIGFEKGINKELYAKSIKDGNVENILRKIHPEKDDVFYIPSGRVHAMGKGITLAEIQQTSDITYRIYDYNRIDINGEPRKLHTQQAMNVADFSYIENPNVIYNKKEENTLLVNSPYFTTTRYNISAKNQKLEDLPQSFRILICLEGECNILSNTSTVQIYKGQSLLIPAILKNIEIISHTHTKLLEVHIE